SCFRRRSAWSASSMTGTPPSWWGPITQRHARLTSCSSVSASNSILGTCRTPVLICSGAIGNLSQVVHCASGCKAANDLELMAVERRRAIGEHVSCLRGRIGGRGVNHALHTNLDLRSHQGHLS